MLSQLNWKLPVSFRRDEIQSALSFDWQIYIACSECGWEVRLDPAFGAPSDNILDKPCDKCGQAERILARHLLKAECICRECSHYFEQYSISGVNEFICPNCTSKKLGVLSLYVTPAFPGKFGEELLPKEQDWGESAVEDSNFIIESLRFANISPDRELQFLPAIKLCQRLRSSSTYSSEADVGLIWNIEGNLLRDYFKSTDETAAGVEALNAFSQSISLTEEPIQKALVIHNLAMICYSLLVKKPQDHLTLDGAPGNLKAMGIENGLAALKVFETGAGSNQPYSSQQVARINHLLGDLYKIGDTTEEELQLSLLYLNKALQAKDMPERTKVFIEESKSVAISKMKHVSKESKIEMERGFENISRRDEKDRAYSEKWSALLNLSMHYWDEGKYEKALINIEEAAAKAFHDLDNVIEISSLELRSRQFVDVFKALLRSMVKAEKGIEGLIVLEKFRALIIKHRIVHSTDEFIRKDETKKITNFLNSLFTGKSGHTSVKKVLWPKEEFITNLKKLAKDLKKSDPVAFVSISVFDGVFSAIVLFISGSTFTIKTFQWNADEQQTEIFSINLTGLMNASIFNDIKFNNLRKISSFFLSTEVYEEIKRSGVKKIGLSIQSIFNLYPYEALEFSKNGAQLIDEFEIFYYPSLEIIHKLSSLTSSSGRMKLLIVPYLGDDLPYSKVELQKLKEIVPHETTIFDGGPYPKKELLEIIEKGDFDFIHFICHGDFDPLNPLESALILNINSGDSGRLYGKEILEIKFKKAPIISLSACSCALTSFDKFETYAGITGSFLQAGVRGILSSRWEIPDEIGCEFMFNCYSSIFLNGRSVLESVRDTQLLLRKRIIGKDWAAFSYLGT
jgi:tetratricopeptide (TPR) repeat protein